MQQNNIFTGYQHWIKYKFGKHAIYFFLIPVWQLGPKCSLLLFSILWLTWFKYPADFQTLRSRFLISHLCLHNSVEKITFYTQASKTKKKRKNPDSLNQQFYHKHILFINMLLKSSTLTVKAYTQSILQLPYQRGIWQVCKYFDSCVLLITLVKLYCIRPTSKNCVNSAYVRCLFLSFPKCSCTNSEFQLNGMCWWIVVWPKTCLASSGKKRKMFI